MKELTLNRIGYWTRGAGVVALLALAWTIFVPGGGLLWSAALAAGLVGTAIAIAVITHNRSIPSLAQVITHAEDEPGIGQARGGYTGGAGLRSRGERKP